VNVGLQPPLGSSIYCIQPTSLNGFTEHGGLRDIYIDTLWLFNVAMDNYIFYWGIYHTTSINGPCSMAMLDNQRVINIVPSGKLT
jgi:hypothetical protein